jgi:hypothetical protein
MKVLPTLREHNTVYPPGGNEQFQPFWQEEFTLDNNKDEFSELIIARSYCSKLSSKYLLYRSDNSIHETNASSADEAILQQDYDVKKIKYIGNKIPVIIEDISILT